MQTEHKDEASRVEPKAIADLKRSLVDRTRDGVLAIRAVSGMVRAAASLATVGRGVGRARSDTQPPTAPAPLPSSVTSSRADFEDLDVGSNPDVAEAPICDPDSDWEIEDLWRDVEVAQSIPVTNSPSASEVSGTSPDDEWSREDLTYRASGALQLPDEAPVSSPSAESSDHSEAQAPLGEEDAAISAEQEEEFEAWSIDDVESDSASYAVGGYPEAADDVGPLELLEVLDDFDPDVAQDLGEVDSGRISQSARNVQLADELGRKYGWTSDAERELLREMIEPVAAAGPRLRAVELMILAGVSCEEMAAAWLVRKVSSAWDARFPALLARSEQHVWKRSGPLSWFSALELARCLGNDLSEEEIDWVFSQSHDAMWRAYVRKVGRYGSWNGPASVGDFLFQTLLSDAPELPRETRTYLLSYGNELDLDDDGEPRWLGQEWEDVIVR